MRRRAHLSTPPRWVADMTAWSVTAGALREGRLARNRWWADADAWARANGWTPLDLLRLRRAYRQRESR